MDCETEKIYLLLSTIFTSFMWILSEIIGSSKCKPNGVFEFAVNGFCVELKYEPCDAHSEDDENVSVEVDETSFFINRKPPHIPSI